MMFSMLKLMARNLVKGPATIRCPGQVPVPDGLRGLVRMDPERCLACGICAYVCVGGAITGSEQDGVYVWRYDPGRCTFCARCADQCPGRALALAPEPPPSYRRPQELSVAQRVPFPPCPGCGRPTRILTAEWLGRAFGATTPETRDLLRLCVACRRKATQRVLKAAAGGER
jgi:ferredoxin